MQTLDPPAQLNTGELYQASRLRRAGLKDATALTLLFRQARPGFEEDESEMLEWLTSGGALVLGGADGAPVCALRWREGEGGWLLDRIATLPEHRSQGYGRWLMTRVEALAIQRNISTLTLLLDETRDDLLTYYGRMGYRLAEGEARVTLSKRVGGTWQYKR